MQSLRPSTAVVTVFGAVLGASIVWLNRPDAASCTTLHNAMRACMPVYVVGPPLWLYAAFAVCGALLAGCVAYASARLVHPR